MANKGSDPRVKEWMKGHTEEVDAVQRRYDELKALSIDELLGMASDGVLAKVRGILIVGIMKKGG